MAAFFGNKLVLPIGCSCITDVQLQLTPGHRYVPYFFDWAGCTIDATIEILSRSGAPFIEHEGDLELVNGRARAKHVAGVHLWHINSFLGLPEMQKISSLADYPAGVDKFVHYHRTMMSRLASEHEEIHCVWTNVQPNLLHHAIQAGEPLSAFTLTAERYAAIKESCRRLRAKKLAVWFVCHKDNMDGSLAGKDDVTVMDLPRSPTEYQGAPGLFDPILEKMGISRAEQAAHKAVTGNR